MKIRELLITSLLSVFSASVVVASPLPINDATKNALTELTDAKVCSEVINESFTGETTLCVEYSEGESWNRACLKWGSKVNKANYLEELKRRNIKQNRCQILKKKYTQSDMILNCSDAPKNAVSSLPGPLNKWGAIRCTLFGHFIGPSPGWVWSHPAGFAPVIIQSQFESDLPDEIGNKGYFKSVSIEKITGSEANKAYSSFSKSFDTSNEDKPTVYKMVATNQAGSSQSAYFFDGGEKNIWGYLCNPKCRPELPFMLLNMKK